MIEENAVEAKIQALKAQREQAVTTIHMLDGAIQVLEGLLAEAAEATRRSGEEGGEGCGR